LPYLDLPTPPALQYKKRQKRGKSGKTLFSSEAGYGEKLPQYPKDLSVPSKKEFDRRRLQGTLRPTATPLSG
jgi:hypothetical protein